VASLEAKLKTTPKALKDADGAKASTVKAAKAAKARAIKTEKALAEVSQKQAKREGGVVKRVNDSTKFLHLLATCSSCLCTLPHFYLSTCFPWLTCIFCDAAKQLGGIIKLHLDSAKDPLLDTVDILESNWRNVQNFLQRTHHVLPCLFIGFFRRRRMKCLLAILGSWSRLLTPWKIPNFS
jgi:hypothetical protein